jgi:DNA-binding NarL/FixJ family response regulator
MPAIKKMYASGKTLAECGKAFKVSQSALRARFESAGLQRRPKSVPLPLPTAKLAKMYASGMSLRACAQIFQVSKATVGARLRAAGVKLRVARRVGAERRRKRSNAAPH